MIWPMSSVGKKPFGIDGEQVARCARASRRDEHQRDAALAQRHVERRIVAAEQCVEAALEDAR